MGLQAQAAAWFGMALVLISLSGCSNVEVREETPAERKRRIEFEQSNRKLNEQWRAGYGFGNDNAERRKQGLPPKNFNGSTGPDKGL